MPPIHPTKHREILDTALPYIPNASVIAQGNYYRAGNNVMTSIRGYAERRPGFVTTSSDDFTVPLNPDFIARRFLWRRWGSAFYEMLNVVTATQSKVYKMKIGTDATFAANLLLTSSSTEPFDFAVSNNHVFFANGTDAKKYDGTTMTNWGITAPAAAVSIALGAGALTATVGYEYVIAFENSTTGHISSPSPISALTTPVAQNPTITGNTTSDAQVTHVRVYRTTDGGSVFFEHPSSPVVYATWVSSGLTDSAADTALLTTVAPLQNQNDRPPALKGIVWFAGRFWGYSGDTVFYSGWEEIPLGTSDAPEEAFPIDNYFPFGAEVTGLGVAGDPNGDGVLCVFCAGVIHKITGDTLDTFRRGTVSRRRGTRQRATITSNGKNLAFLDTSDTVQITDGSAVEEIGLAIRPDTQGITHSGASMTYHDDGLRHWLVLVDGGAGKLRVMDLDKGHWMVPWTLATCTAIHSGETAEGTLKLMIGRSGKPLELSTSTYSDDGTAFVATLTTGLANIAEDPSPDSRGYVDYISIERNTVGCSDVGICIDDDPVSGSFTSLIGNERNPPYRTNGAALIEKQYPTERGPVGRRVSVKLDWPAVATNFALYSLDTAYHEK